MTFEFDTYTDESGSATAGKRQHANLQVRSMSDCFFVARLVTRASWSERSQHAQ